MNVNLDTTVGMPYSGINILDRDSDTNINSQILNMENSVDPNTTNTANYTILIVLICIVIGYYLIFSSLGDSQNNSMFSMMNSNESSNSTTTTLEILLWGVFLTLILLNGLSYFFNFNVTASLKNVFKGEPTVDLIANPNNIVGEKNSENLPETNIVDEEKNDSNSGTKMSFPTLSMKKQVFHIPNNVYTYDDAKAVCKAYDARLATYNELESAYNNGADWCGYGWSEGQMAFYPTQFDKWQNLQKIKGHEHDCGRPGINGGYIANPNVRFGINCYGNKPQITQEESKLMQDVSKYPKTQRELEFEKKVLSWKERLPEILVAPFNNGKWSE